MDVRLHLCSTDEEEEIDIEGGIDDIIKPDTDKNNDEQIEVVHNSATTNKKHCLSEKDCATKRKYPADPSSNGESVPFKRKNLKTDVNVKINTHESNNEITSWWKTVSEKKTQNGPDVKEASKIKSDEDVMADDEKNRCSTTQECLLCPTLTASSETVSKASEKPEEPVMISESGVEFHPPECEVVLSLSEASEREKEYFSDFFDGTTKYTPERYMMIRNAILDMWRKQKPKHLNKVALRPILKKKCCGNVNNIGRIHRYLESVGAINFGSAFVWWKTKVRKRKEDRRQLGSEDKLKKLLQQRMSGRNRRKPTHLSFGFASVDWEGGYTIDHVNNNSLILPEPSVPSQKRVSNKRTQTKKYSLINCKQYLSEEDCPYDVIVSAAAMFVMDTHAHISKHEVMGLLGGYVTYGPDHLKKVRVHIVSAQPCRSAGSARHCEMDPVSQSEANESLTIRGLQVVGWYHSHPTFPPQPSHTDIHTQMNQQNLFTSHGSVFLGIILSPYLCQKLLTQFNMVHISVDVESGNETPYQVPYKICSDSLDGNRELQTDILEILTVIIEDATRKENASASRVQDLLNPVVPGSSIRQIDKLMKSLLAHVSPQTNLMALGASNSGTVSPLSQIDQEGNVVLSQLSETDEISQDSLDVMTPQPDHHDVQYLDNVTHDDKTLFPYDETIQSYSIQENFPGLSEENLCPPWESTCLGEPSTFDEEILLPQNERNDLTCNDMDLIPSSWKGFFKEVLRLLLDSRRNHTARENISYV